MNRLTLGEIKDTVARALGVCNTASKVADFVNEAQERLLNRPGRAVGSFQRYRICTNSSCITLPRQIRTVERFAICDDPGMVMPEWFEFQFNAIGIQDEDNMPGNMLIDRGTACTFEDITAGETDRKIRITCDVAEDASTYIWLYGYDENANWIRTQVGGVWVDGERLDLNACPQNSTNFFTSLVRVKKDETDGVVRLYEYDNTGAAVVQALAYYEPSEISPIYRRVFVPGLQNMSTCDGAEDACTNKSITLYALLQHVPVAVDNDALVIGNRAAIKLMCMAIKMEEEDRLQEAAILENKAIAELEGELSAYHGAGMRVGLSFEDTRTWGAGDIENVI